MRTLRQNLGRFPLAFGTLGLLTVMAVTGAAIADTPATPKDYDLCAARALFNAIRPGSVPNATNLPAHLPRKLDVWNVESDKRTYAINFGSRGGEFDDRGYYKIVLNGELSDATAGGWKILIDRDEKTGAQVFWKRVERSTADKFTYVGIRRKIGNVILTIAQRRSFAEDPKTGAGELIERFASLIEHAKENKLFARVAIIQVGEDGSEREIDIAKGPILFSVKPGAEPTEVMLRAEVRDAEDNLLGDIEQFGFQVAGPLVEYIIFEGATYDASKKRWIVRNQDVAEVKLKLDPAGGRLVNKLYEPFTRGRPDSEEGKAAIRLRVGVKMKKTMS